VADEPLAHAKLRAGGQLVVLDASNWGVLTETTARLLPGQHLIENLLALSVTAAKSFVWLTVIVT
jgi:hypothetical protein